MSMGLLFTLSRRTLRVLARAMVAVLLFTQLAVAAYACPWATASAKGVAAAIPCHGAMGQADVDSPALCAQHCQAGDQSDQVRSPALPGVWMLALYPALQPASTAGDVHLRRHATAPPGERHAVAPPLAIVHCVHRL